MDAVVTVQGAGVTGSITLMPLLAVNPPLKLGSCLASGEKRKSNISPTVRYCSVSLVYQLEHQLPLSIASQSSVAICKRKKKNYKHHAYLHESVDSVMPGTSHHQ